MTGNNFEKDWYIEQDGDGSTTYSTDGKLVSFTSSTFVDSGGVFVNKAYLRQYIQIHGGEVVRLRVLCRVVTGTALLAIDYPGRAEPAVTKTLNSTDHGYWQEHELLCRVGDSIVTSADTLSVVIGSTLTVGGTVEIARVNVDMESGTNGALRTHACGSIVIAKDGAGAVTVVKDNNLFQTNILGIVNGGTSVDLTLELRDSTENFIPDGRHGALSFASISSSSITGLSVYPSLFNNTTGAFSLALSNSSGAFDVSTASMPNSTSIRIFFEVKTL